MAHFSVDVYAFDSIGNNIGPNDPFTKSFNGDWCTFDEITASDPIKASAGIHSKITYFPGGAAGNATAYYATETVEELTALANGGSGS